MTTQSLPKEQRQIANSIKRALKNVLSNIQLATDLRLENHPENIEPVETDIYQYIRYLEQIKDKVDALLRTEDRLFEERSKKLASKFLANTSNKKPSHTTVIETPNGNFTLPSSDIATKQDIGNQGPKKTKSKAELSATKQAKSTLSQAESQLTQTDTLPQEQLPKATLISLQYNLERITNEIEILKTKISQQIDVPINPDGVVITTPCMNY